MKTLSVCSYNAKSLTSAICYILVLNSGYPHLSSTSDYQLVPLCDAGSTHFQTWSVWCVLIPLELLASQSELTLVTWMHIEHWEVFSHAVCKCFILGLSGIMKKIYFWRCDFSFYSITRFTSVHVLLSFPPLCLYIWFQYCFCITSPWVLISPLLLIIDLVGMFPLACRQ